MMGNIIHLMNSIRGLIVFFIGSQHSSRLNIDGLFGLCAIEGVAKYILEIESVPQVTKHILLELERSSRHVVNNSLLHIKELDKEYYATIGFLLESSWKPHVIYQSLPFPDAHLSPNLNNNDKFSEHQSDMCFHDAHKSSGLCTFNADCLNLMVFTDSAEGYFLTHQILYATLIESYGCHSVSVPGGSTVSLRSRLGQLCGRAHVEHLRHKSALLDGVGQLRHTRRLTFDLMLEQVFACGRIGFAQFAADGRLLDALLAAQDPDRGCFGAPPPPPPTLSQPLSRRPSRKLREVRHLDGGCELHLTGVAACAASVYLMLLLDPAAPSVHKLSPHSPLPLVFLLIVPVSAGLLAACCFCRGRPRRFGRPPLLRGLRLLLQPLLLPRQPPMWSRLQ